MDYEDKKSLGVTKSDNTKGNPYHAGKGSSEGGQFVSKEEAGVGEESQLPKVATAGAPPTPPNNGPKATATPPFPNNIKDWLAMHGVKKKSEEEIKQAQLKKKKVDAILKNPLMSKEKLNGLSIEELQKVEEAIVITSKKEQKIYDELQEYNKGVAVGPWLEPKYPADYAQLKLSGAFENKKKYFENTFNGPQELKDEMLKTLDEFQEKGEKYIAEKSKAEEKYKKYDDIIQKYQDDSPYSQARKDAAVWIKSGDEVFQMLKIVGEKTNSYMDTLKKVDSHAYSVIVGYTGSYHWITDPLRKKKYTGGWGSDIGQKFVSTIKAMDRAIDGSSYDQDIWVKRGTNNLMIKNLGDAIGVDLAKIPESEYESLVGTMFKDNSFVSTAGSKNTGFSGNIKMYIYCPKGTNMLHMSEHGNYYNENEFVLARGYTYKITKVYKEGWGGIALDCEVVLGSNSDRYSDEELDSIAKKYF